MINRKICEKCKLWQWHLECIKNTWAEQIFRCFYENELDNNCPYKLEQIISAQEEKK
jgi:hypothetical protein